MATTAKLNSYDFGAAERRVLYGTTDERQQIKSELQIRKSRLDYFMTRFLDTNDVDHLQPGSNEMRFYKDKCTEYTNINRLLRVIDGYKRV